MNIAPGVGIIESGSLGKELGILISDLSTHERFDFCIFIAEIWIRLLQSFIEIEGRNGRYIRC